MTDTAPATFITVVIPVLNEADYIGACLTSLLPQLGENSEVFVMDGGSTDGTQAIVADFTREYPGVKLVHNPRKIQSAACNLAAQMADPRSTILLRADAHAGYPATFVSDCVRAFHDSGAASVVVPMQTLGTQGFQRAIAAAQNSKLGNGGSAHRAGGVSGFVDHGHHAAFNLAFFKSIGGYNDTFTHNEDAEYDVRLHRAGGRVWMCREAAIQYYPRSTLGALARQYARHGAGRARTLMTHGITPRPRQMAPVIILLANLGSLVLAPFLPIMLLIPLAYMAMCLLWGVRDAVKQHDPMLAGMGLAAMAMHHGWAFGFLRQVIRMTMNKGITPAVSPALA